MTCPPEQDDGGPFSIADIEARWRNVPTWHTGPAASKDIHWLIATIAGLHAEHEAMVQQILDVQRRAEDAERESDAAGRGWAEAIALNRLVVRDATDDEQRDALLRVLQQRTHAGDATHDCGEWRHGLLCGLCGRWLDA